MGRPASAAPAIRPISPMLEESRYIRYFLMFEKMPRPSSTAATMEAKLSSVSVIAAASLETSVPVMPIAMPMSAFLSAGASFTPSPVMATTSPRFWSAVTTRSLCAGETRAHTGAGFGPRRVDHADESDQRHLALGVLRRGVPFIRDGQHAQRVAGHLPR